MVLEVIQKFRLLLKEKLGLVTHQVTQGAYDISKREKFKKRQIKSGTANYFVRSTEIRKQLVAIKFPTLVQNHSGHSLPQIIKFHNIQVHDPK